MVKQHLFGSFCLPFTCIMCMGPMGLMTTNNYWSVHYVNCHLYFTMDIYLGLHTHKQIV